MNSNQPTITYTFTDEAPALATTFLYPILQTILPIFGVATELKSISLADRVLALFTEHINHHVIADDLQYLKNLVLSPHCQIIKLPNISASLFQLKQCIAELQAAGYPLPNYPEQPTNPHQQKIQQCYHAALGSAVNPMLRIGNSIRYIPPAVKQFAAKNPHPMGTWSSSSKSQVRSMSSGSFYHTEKTHVATQPCTLRIVFIPHSSTDHPTHKVLVEDITMDRGDVVDGATLARESLQQFITHTKQEAQQQNLIFSLHLKATMMKVSDPVIFGYALEAYLADYFQQHHHELQQLEVDPNQGLADLIQKINQAYSSDTTNPQHLPQILTDLYAALDAAPRLAMVDSTTGITNFHVPSDIIIDASMAAMIRGGGKMWDRHGQADDTLAVIPDPSYAELYTQTINFCKQHGAFDPTSMGSVSNIGLMAYKAQEYGSHPTTFIADQAGTFVVEATVKLSPSSQTSSTTTTRLLEHTVQAGDIWRMCITKHQAIANWIQTTIDHICNQPPTTDEKVVVWLDPHRAHDAALITKVHDYLLNHAPHLLNNQAKLVIKPPLEACQETLARLQAGLNTVSVTGNVLRDYITDLFPILELGTSAKMLSVIGLLNGGRMFETGSGGTAPKHVDQLLQENHLRWDSLGEFLALEQAAAFLAQTTANPAIDVLSQSLSRATQSYLTQNQQPSRKCGERDTRGSHFLWLCSCIKAMAHHPTQFAHQLELKQLSTDLQAHRSTILAELTSCQGQPVLTARLGGYYLINLESADKVMNPSPTFRRIWNNFTARVSPPQ